MRMTDDEAIAAHLALADYHAELASHSEARNHHRDLALRLVLEIERIPDYARRRHGKVADQGIGTASPTG